MCFELSLSEFNISPRSELVACGVTVTKPPLFTCTCTNHTASLFTHSMFYFFPEKNWNLSLWVVLQGGPLLSYKWSLYRWPCNWATGLITLINRVITCSTVAVLCLEEEKSESINSQVACQIRYGNWQWNITKRLCRTGPVLGVAICLSSTQGPPHPTPESSGSFTGGLFKSSQGIRFQKFKSSKC